MSLAQILIHSVIVPILSIIFMLLIVGVIMSWLVAFNVINLQHPTVRQLYQILERFNNAILDPIRRVVPPIGGLDFSPIVAIIGIQLLQNILLFKLSPMVG